MSSAYTQQYKHEDAKDGSAPLLPEVQPRWMQKDKSPHPRRLKLALGALAVTYLLYCGWVAYSRHDSYLEAPSDIGVFPHPFPHPPTRPHHPPGPPPPPEISVLGCVLIPSIDKEEFTSEKVKLSVSYPVNATVVLPNKLLFGDLAVEKVDEDDKGEESTLNVSIKVASRPPFGGHAVDSETGEEEKFVLCATTFVPHKPPMHPPPHLEIEGEHLPPPHPHGPPVIVDIFPALNETYPKLPPPFPHHPRRRHYPHHRHHRSKLSTVWRATVSFLFPMFTKVADNHTSHPCPGAPHPPPLPPFIVTLVSATIPKTSHVAYGLPPPPFFHFPHPHPHPHPHHPPPNAQ